MWCSRIRDVFKPQVENRVAQFELASRLVLGCIPEKYHKSLYIYGHSVKYLCGKENGIERLEEGRNIKVIDFIAFVYQSIPLFNDEFSMLYYRSCVEYKDISPFSRTFAADARTRSKYGNLSTTDLQCGPSCTDTRLETDTR